VRKSSEFDDDISMERRVLQQFRIAKYLSKPHAAILIGQQLGMHQRIERKTAASFRRSLDRSPEQAPGLPPHAPAE